MYVFLKQANEASEQVQSCFAFTERCLQIQDMKAADITDKLKILQPRAHTSYSMAGSMQDTVALGQTLELERR